MFREDDLLPVRALSDLVFCERRAALHFVERMWEDNLFTVQGTHLHERVHAQENESRGDVRVARGLPLRSLRLGLVGKADVVEFHRLVDTADDQCPMTSDSSAAVMPSDAMAHALPGDAITRTLRIAVSLPGVDGFWRPFPVEYKRGKPKPDDCDKVQICAQALCLEEMLGAQVPAGAMFYGATRRRFEVEFDEYLRETTEDAARRLHELIRSQVTPMARHEKKCRNCSLLEQCLPKLSGRSRSAVRYLEEALEDPGT